MASNGVLFGLVVYCVVILSGVDAFALKLKGHGWDLAHATFYGTPDTNGMGK